MRLNRAVLRRVAIVAFVLLAVGFFAFALVDAWNATNGELPSAPRLVAAGALVALGLIAAAYAWGALLGERRVDHGAALLVSQLGKYVPGGVWQATGQVGLARAAGVRVQRGVSAFTILALTQALAGCAYALVLAFAWSKAALGLRVLLAAGSAVTLFLLDRRWMVWALHKFPRTREASQELVPGQRTIIFAWLASIATLAATSGAYLLILTSLTPVDDQLLVVAGYATAWMVGFVALPIPSGVGVREAVLIGILHGSFPSSVIVAASVYHRLVSIAAEGVMAAIASHRVRPRRASAARTRAIDESSITDLGAEPSEAPRPDNG